MLEKLGVERGHAVVAKIDAGDGSPDFSTIDVAIDFSTPQAAFDNITTCFKHNIPVISGTTGWLSRYDDAVAQCKSRNGAFIHATNFSLGVNIFFEINKRLAAAMNAQEGYQLSLEETHHTQKLDAPSGTAITLAEGIIAQGSYTGWKLDGGNTDEIPIIAKREANVPGTHIVCYSSTIDTLEIKHTAHNREGFALGALVAAEWIIGKTGVFSMKDVLNLG